MRTELFGQKKAIWRLNRGDKAQDKTEEFEKKIRNPKEEFKYVSLYGI